MKFITRLIMCACLAGFAVTQVSASNTASVFKAIAFKTVQVNKRFAPDFVSAPKGYVKYIVNRGGHLVLNGPFGKTLVVVRTGGKLSSLGAIILAVDNQGGEVELQGGIVKNLKKNPGKTVVSGNALIVKQYVASSGLTSRLSAIIKNKTRDKKSSQSLATRGAEKNSIDPFEFQSNKSGTAGKYMERTFTGTAMIGRTGKYWRFVVKSGAKVKFESPGKNMQIVFIVENGGVLETNGEINKLVNKGGKVIIKGVTVVHKLIQHSGRIDLPDGYVSRLKALAGTIRLTNGAIGYLDAPGARVVTTKFGYIIKKSPRTRVSMNRNFVPAGYPTTVPECIVVINQVAGKVTNINGSINMSNVDLRKWIAKCAQKNQCLVRKRLIFDGAFKNLVGRVDFGNLKLGKHLASCYTVSSTFFKGDFTFVGGGNIDVTN